MVLGLTPPCALGSTYILTDDDAQDVLPRFPDGGQLLVPAYGRAYILPQYAGASYEDIVDFVLHLSDGAVEYGTGPWASGRDLSSETGILDLSDRWLLGALRTLGRRSGSLLRAGATVHRACRGRRCRIRLYGLRFRACRNLHAGTCR